MQNSKLATLFGTLLLTSMLAACGSGGETAAPVASANDTAPPVLVGGGYPIATGESVSAPPPVAPVEPPPVAQTPVSTPAPAPTPTPAPAPTVGSATLSWTPPTQNTDGSSLANLAGYRIYYGTKADALTQSIQITNPGLTAYTVGNLVKGTYYFAIAAYTTDGVEGQPSQVGSKTI